MFKSLTELMLFKSIRRVIKVLKFPRTLDFSTYWQIRPNFLSSDEDYWGLVNWWTPEIKSHRRIFTPVLIGQLVSQVSGEFDSGPGGNRHTALHAWPAVDKDLHFNDGIAASLSLKLFGATGVQSELIRCKCIGRPQLILTCYWK